MSERRVQFGSDKPQHREDGKLKAIAGLLQKLTYKEMNELSDLLQKHEQLAVDEGYPDALLTIADEILAA